MRIATRRGVPTAPLRPLPRDGAVSVMRVITQWFNNRAGGRANAAAKTGARCKKRKHPGPARSRTKQASKSKPAPCAAKRHKTAARERQRRQLLAKQQVLELALQAQTVQKAAREQRSLRQQQRQLRQREAAAPPSRWVGVNQSVWV